MTLGVLMAAACAILPGSILLAADESAALRRVSVSLDGVWQIGEGGLESPPAIFDRKVPVPGLVDMAEPAFSEPGPSLTHLDKFSQKDPRRDAFWYRRTFTLAGPLPTVATLKVGKAMFGMRAILNGKLLGDHPACFTTGLFDAREALKTGDNELVIRVGADRNVVPANAPSGFDYEKKRYIPGIFDSVELVLGGAPHIVNLQVAPDLAKSQARVRVWLKHAAAGELAVEIREAKSGTLVGTATARLTTKAEQTLDLDVPISGCRWWSPEDPFLYQVTARTSGDQFQTRFGMRTFKFDPATGRAVLNGKPYFMRGSNITLYRFFEDPQRGSLPWNEAWVRTLHRRVKDMHWNCLRYCIGFPPEFWYRIADEEGILIQDEFPIWNMEGGQAAEYDVDGLAAEFRQWLQERWNHPCVVIWDACNETHSPDVAKAFTKVRGLDLSNRPWDNGWQPPQDPGDCIESHPYHFINRKFKLCDLAQADPARVGNLGNFKKDKHAVVINEYAWLWLNRDGTPTTLTNEVYANLLGGNSTTAQRRLLYARYFAAVTEFWRCHRHAAAVMHFTALGYSRPGGQTSDEWVDVAGLVWEPEFQRHVRDAFAPVGLMIDAWAEAYPAGENGFPVVVINDLYGNWKGTVRLRLLREGTVVKQTAQACEVPAIGEIRLQFMVDLPEQAGKYQLEATLIKDGTEPVRSLRDFRIDAK